MNVLVLSIFGVMLLFSAMMAVGEEVYRARTQDGQWYLQWTGAWPDLNVVRVRLANELVDGFGGRKHVGHMFCACMDSKLCAASSASCDREPTLQSSSRIES
jgi:hypothetical protein